MTIVSIRFDRCKENCPCGNRCSLRKPVKHIKRVDVSYVHELHICEEPDCYCHTEQRYVWRRSA